MGSVHCQRCLRRFLDALIVFASSCLETGESTSMAPIQLRLDAVADAFLRYLAEVCERLALFLLLRVSESYGGILLTQKTRSWTTSQVPCRIDNSGSIERSSQCPLSCDRQLTHCIGTSTAFANEHSWKWYSNGVAIGYLLKAQPDQFLPS
jgi:hypothetical protein